MTLSALNCGSSNSCMRHLGKLTQANKHLVLAYHQIQECVQDDKAIVLLKVYTGWNLADLMTKNPSFQMVQRGSVEPKISTNGPL